MPMPAARVTDMHIHGAPPIIIAAGPIIPPCAITTLIGGLPAARMTDFCICPLVPPVPPLGILGDVIVMGSPTVLISGLPAARMLDPTAAGGIILLGWPTVLIGP